MLEKPPRFHKPLIDWYLENARDLPWRRTKDPYLVWLSEIILQQTRVDQGMAYYLDFAEHYPTVHDLAAASETEVLKRWQGLGYYSRARNLHHTAKYVVDQLDGVFPKTYERLIELKGIGDYTASAISSICGDEPCAVVDGNVYRVLARLLGEPTPINSTKGKKLFKTYAQTLIDLKRPGTFNQAMMEFGARYCVPANPDCEACIFRTDCEGYKHGMVKELPKKEAKVKVKDLNLYFLVLLSPDGRTMIEKRMAGIWKHLYQFPLVESATTLDLDQLEEQPQFKPYLDGALTAPYWYNTEPVRHKLSHRNLDIYFCVIEAQLPLDIGIKIGSIQDYPVPVVLERFISEFPPFSP